MIGSIAAHIDLLGFSEHLQLANNDIRSKIGNEAIKRLKTIEQAISLFEKERDKYKYIYPNNFYYRRFNDSLFLVMDVESMTPIIGEVNIPYGYSGKELMSAAKNEIGYKDTKAREGYEVAKFVGLVSRIHNFISSKEKENNFPGCRTVISSGLRKRFKDRLQTEDFFSANFSLSNAYITNKEGESGGFPGNQLYLEDNVATAIGFNKYYKTILSYSRFFRIARIQDPYEDYHYGYDDKKKSIFIQTDDFILAKKIEISLFRKKYYFRNLNANVLSVFQLLPLFNKYLEGKKPPDEFTEKIVESIKQTAPPLDEIRKDINRIINYPLLALAFNLDEDLKQLTNELNQQSAK